MNMKLVFLVSGLLAGGLGFLIFFASTATQEIECLILFVIGAVLLSVVVMMDTISLAQKEIIKSLEKFLKAPQQRSEAGQKDSTESQVESQVA